VDLQDVVGWMCDQASQVLEYAHTFWGMSADKLFQKQEVGGYAQEGKRQTYSFQGKFQGIISRGSHLHGHLRWNGDLNIELRRVLQLNIELCNVSSPRVQYGTVEGVR